MSATRPLSQDEILEEVRETLKEMKSEYILFMKRPGLQTKNYLQGVEIFLSKLRERLQEEELRRYRVLYHRLTAGGGLP
jgi:hypothetical protein